jgi:hypothetical protein
MDKPWSWETLSYHSNITWQIIKDNLDKPWDWDHVSMNPNITWSIVQTYSGMPWKWRTLAKYTIFSKKRYYKLYGTYIEKSEYKKLVQPILEHIVPIELSEHIVSFI